MSKPKYKVVIKGMRKAGEYAEKTFDLVVAWPDRNDPAKLDINFPEIESIAFKNGLTLKPDQWGRLEGFFTNLYDNTRSQGDNAFPAREPSKPNEFGAGYDDDMPEWLR